MSELTEKQRLFCDEYMKDFNGTQAALRSGYSQKNAKVSAVQLLSSTNVQAYLAKKKAELAAKTQITQEQIVEGYRRLAFFDSRKFYKDGKLLNVDSLDEETAYALSAFETSTIDTDYGARISTGKIKMSDRVRALDSLCRVLGYNSPDKTAFVNPDGTPGKPIQLLTDEQFKLLIETINK